MAFQKARIGQKVRKEIRNKEAEWLSKKQELVKKETIYNNISEECVDKRSKRMILDHKKIRLNANYAMHEKEIKEIEFSLKQLREYEMVKFGKKKKKNNKTRKWPQRNRRNENIYSQTEI